MQDWDDEERLRKIGLEEMFHFNFKNEKKRVPNTKMIEWHRKSAQKAPFYHENEEEET